MPQRKEKGPPEPATAGADIVSFPGSPDDARAELALRGAFGDIQVSEDVLSRLMECVRNIRRNQDKIARLIIDMGADLQTMYDCSTDLANAHYSDPRAARSRGWDLFCQIAEQALDLTPSKAELYLNLYRRFLNHNGALSKLNVGELMILRRKDYTDGEIDAVIEYKENDPSFHRDNIREFVKRLRSQQEDLSETQNKLDITTAELATTVAENTEKDFEIRKLNAEIARLTEETDANRTALSNAREELTRQNSSFSRLQMQIDDLEREKRELQDRIAYSKTHTRPETVEIEVIPPGFASLQDALAAKNDQIAAANAELASLQQKRDELGSEISEHQSVIESRTNAQAELTKLVSMFESIVSTFASAQLAVQMVVQGDGNVVQFHPTLKVLDSVVARLHTDIRSALKTR